MSSEHQLSNLEGSPSAPGSVSRNVAAVKAGDPRALADLWNRYYPALLNKARSRLSDAGIRVADEEDVVAAAFDAFYRAASQGHYPDLLDRNALWRVLLTITANKALDLIRSEKCEVRGGGRVLGESALGGADSFESDAGFRNLISEEPTPEFVALVAENFQRRLQVLDDEVLRSVALLKLQGYLSREIAEMLEVSERAIERKLSLIRKLWSAAEDRSDNASR
ncbi:MAG: RNA polymerase subunit sigma-70 [Planctomycetales bacterium]|nr:RNA polymerase subunit sigma-70 [Planctomycetales bacterium]